MNIPQFIAKWRQVQLTERSASQQHFLDLCSVLQHPTPAEADPLGEWFTFEKGADKHGGGKGWADVWKRAFFGWEYKGRHTDLEAAYDQLLKYREALENPPLLVVCDMDRFQIHTNFTATATKIYEISLDDLDEPRNIEIMRRVFFDPEKLRPDATSEAITQEVARRLAEVAQGLRDRNIASMDVARFLDRIVFCLFAEDVGLLPPKLFSQIVEKSRDSQHFSKLIGQLFDAMAQGGDFGLETIKHFNGNLFTDSPVLELTPNEIKRVQAAARLDWSAVDPSIFGTLFQRGLDPDTRAQLGAQYTSREDIETLIEPVVMQPLRREWQQIKIAVEDFLQNVEKTAPARDRLLTLRGRRKAYLDATRQPRNRLRHFHEKLCSLKVLDPACGSGNFLYVTLQKLKDLEKELLVYAAERLYETLIPQVGPWQFYGIEINPYAFELAQTTLWIGYLQWIQSNGFGVPVEPILREMDNFKNMDAILDQSDPGEPKEPEWPAADFIIGNPPFLGGGKIREELGVDYQQKLRRVYEGRLPGFSDLVCYWFEKSRKQIAEGLASRAGLLATQGIRGGANRRVLERVKETGNIFFARSDQNWILDGANVHVSMVGFDRGEETTKILDDRQVTIINADLTSHIDITTAAVLNENRSICFMGPSPKAPFDIPETLALEMCQSPNASRLPNSDVIRPVASAVDLTQRSRSVWTLDFANVHTLEEAAKYEQPFEYLKEVVFPIRGKNPKQTNAKWWQYERPRVEMRQALNGLSRFLATPAVSKHRVFVWRGPEVLCNQGTLVFASSEDWFLGVIHSRLHEVWARAKGTQVRERESGFRYTPTTCFETFPFPMLSTSQKQEIGAAAKALDDLRVEWLNPSEWTVKNTLEFPGSLLGPWAGYIVEARDRDTGTVLFSRPIARNEEATLRLTKRTLTNLYNESPTWLQLAHSKLDELVFAAFGWNADQSNEEILARLLELNHSRSESDT